MKGKQKIGDSSTNVVDECDGDMFFTAANDLVEDHNSWVLDSTTNMHICRDQVSFDTFQEDGDFDYIHAASNEKLNIEGMGRVCLKLYNSVVKMLTNILLNVKHIFTS